MVRDVLSPGEALKIMRDAAEAAKGNVLQRQDDVTKSGQAHVMRATAGTTVTQYRNEEVKRCDK
jgi:hypothetical protein